MLRRFIPFALIFALLCANVPAPALAGVSTGQEVQLGKESDKQITEQTGVVTDPLLNAWVNEISQKLWAQVARKDVPYNIKILDANDINAFTTLGGYIYIYEGTLDFVQSDDELASVIGHETGHDERRHAIGFQNKANISSLLIGIGSLFSPIVYRFGQLAQAGFLAKVSREQELQADRYGLLLMSRAGYDPDAAVSFMQHLGVLHDEKSGIVDKYFADHPGVPNRVAHLVGYPQLDPKVRTTEQILVQALHDEQEGRYNVASIKFAQVLKAEPDNTVALLHLGQLQVALGQVNKGEQSLGEAAAKGSPETRTLALSGIRMLRDQERKYSLLKPNVQPLRDQVIEAQAREKQAVAAVATRRDGAKDQLKALNLRLQGLSASLPDFSRINPRKGGRLDAILKNINAMGRAIDTVMDKGNMVIGGVGTMERNKESGLLKDDNEILGSMLKPLDVSPLPPATLATLSEYPKLLADMGATDGDMIRAVDAARASYALCDVGLNDLNAFILQLTRAQLDFTGDLRETDYAQLAPLVQKAVDSLGKAAVAASQAAQLYNMARSLQLQTRISLLGVGYPDTRYETLQRALAARFKNLPPIDYRAMVASDLTAGEVTAATIVAADTNTTPDAIVQEAKTTHRSIVDVANARGMHAEALEIFLGLIYLDYVDDPAKEAKGVT